MCGNGFGNCRGNCCGVVVDCVQASCLADGTWNGKDAGEGWGIKWRTKDLEDIIVGVEPGAFEAMPEATVQQLVPLGLGNVYGAAFIWVNSLGSNYQVPDRGVASVSSVLITTN